MRNSDVDMEDPAPCQVAYFSIVGRPLAGTKHWTDAKRQARRRTMKRKLVNILRAGSTGRRWWFGLLFVDDDRYTRMEARIIRGQPRHTCTSRNLLRGNQPSKRSYAILSFQMSCYQISMLGSHDCLILLVGGQKV
jgi:hypothetical protein